MKKIFSLLILPPFLLCGCGNKAEVPKTYTLPYPFEGAVVENNGSTPWFVTLMELTQSAPNKVIPYEYFAENFGACLDENNYKLGIEEEIIPDHDYIFMNLPQLVAHNYFKPTPLVNTYSSF